MGSRPCEVELPARLKLLRIEADDINLSTTVCWIR